MAREQTKMITSIGGQALMEGVMMRGPKKTSVAVRLPDETIDVEELKTKSARLAELNAMLDLNKKDNEIVDDDREDEEPSEPARSDRDCR